MSPPTFTRTIIVGYDASETARAAVKHAIDRATPAGRIILVHAYLVPADYIGATYYNVMLEDSAQYAEGVLSALERDCEALAKVEYVRDICVGHAAAAIVRAADVYEADEIVIGSRGVGRVRAMLGSVAHDVLHHASCPVTVIPESMVESGTVRPAATMSAV